MKRKDDDLAHWAAHLEGFVVQPDDREIEIAIEITRDHPDWVQEQQNAADPWVIANAVAHGRVILTEEVPKGPGTIDKNLKVPNVAAEFVVPCMSFNQLARDEHWAF